MRLSSLLIKLEQYLSCHLFNLFLKKVIQLWSISLEENYTAHTYTQKQYCIQAEFNGLKFDLFHTISVFFSVLLLDCKNFILIYFDPHPPLFPLPALQLHPPIGFFMNPMSSIIACIELECQCRFLSFSPPFSAVLISLCFETT